MTKYTPEWDLSTIPTPELTSEYWKRARKKAPRATNVNLQPCSKCGEKLTATQRRNPCPKCDWKNTKRTNEGGWIPNPYAKPAESL